MDETEFLRCIKLAKKELTQNLKGRDKGKFINGNVGVCDVLESNIGKKASELFYTSFRPQDVDEDDAESTYWLGETYSSKDLPTRLLFIDAFVGVVLAEKLYKEL